MGKKEHKIIGYAGELVAAAKLTELGYYVGVINKDAPGIDILVSNGKAAKMIQVKTTKTGKPVWVCQKPEVINSNIVYIFVGLNDDAPNFFHIASSKEVLKTIEKTEEYDTKKYEEKNNKKRPQTDRGVPHFVDVNGRFKNKWKNIGLPIEKTD